MRCILAPLIRWPNSLCHYTKSDYRSWGDPRLQGDNYEKNLLLLNVIKSIAFELDATPAQIAIAWLLHQGYDIVPIPGCRKVHHLEDNLGAISLTLSDEQLATLSHLTSKIGVAGDRYSKELLKFTDRQQ
ncbi:aldo/keto reductase [Vibrio fluvialis]|nr:aldo/keto reductase [Vibrio fluvialis]